jgi:hypothetical protein
MGCANLFPKKIWGQVTRKWIENGSVLYSDRFAQLSSIALFLKSLSSTTNRSSKAVLEQLVMPPRGVGGAVLFERVKFHDATKQMNDSGPHSPFTSGAKTHRASPTDVRPIRWERNYIALRSVSVQL